MTTQPTAPLAGTVELTTRECDCGDRLSLHTNPQGVATWIDANGSANCWDGQGQHAPLAEDPFHN